MPPETASLTLIEAMLRQMPWWLYVWLVPVVLTNFAAVLFIVGRRDGRWIFRLEALAILVGFLVASEVMEWIYDQMGYVRLLGVGHLVGWTPAYIWILTRRKLHDPATTLFGEYLILYFVLDGICLLIDFIDMVRHFVGV